MTSAISSLLLWSVTSFDGCKQNLPLVLGSKGTSSLFYWRPWQLDRGCSRIFNNFQLSHVRFISNVCWVLFVMKRRLLRLSLQSRSKGQRSKRQQFYLDQNFLSNFPEFSNVALLLCWRPLWKSVITGNSKMTCKTTYVWRFLYHVIASCKRPIVAWTRFYGLSPSGLNQLSGRTSELVDGRTSEVVSSLVREDSGIFRVCSSHHCVKIVSLAFILISTGTL